MNTPRRTILILTVVLCALAATPAAQASTSCGYTAFKEPFIPWGDSGDYILSKSGNFDGGSNGWTLKNGAKLVSGGNTLLSSSAKSLYLPVGSYALSPSTCIETNFPYARMFAMTSTPDAYQTNTLRVDVQYMDAVYNKLVTEPAGVVTQTAGWAPTDYLTLPNPENIKPDSKGKVWVTYKFTPLYRSAWKIDDFYVDPKRR
jgi:hypothetical protein